MSLSSQSPDDARWNLMFRELKHRVALPSEKHPATRIWCHSDLAKEIIRVKKDHQAELRSTFPAAKAVIARMLEMEWLRGIPVDWPAGSSPASPIYLLDMEAAPDESPEPWELLQGYQPDGVLCYFGAAALHELTTQVPPFYHIAVPRPPSARAGEEAPQAPTPTDSPDKKPRDPLGTMAFRYQGLACYSTRPEAALMPGIQTREYGQRTRLRITTPEQTMLDALWQPLKCGGQAVAFEIWERGVPKWNPDRMAKHLQAINRHEWDRRVGAMLSLLGAEPGADTLGNLLHSRQDEVRRAPDLQPLPLLSGLPVSYLIPAWGILAP